ncbi:MAG: hypothetical protein AAFV47_01035 [Pseudomonadota bacterium]
MPVNLDELLEHVNDRESFLVFARALMNDRKEEVRSEIESPSSPYGPGSNGWENGSIEAYLDAAIAWSKDSIGSGAELPEEPAWQSFARFLYAGKYYE